MEDVLMCEVHLLLKHLSFCSSWTHSSLSPFQPLECTWKWLDGIAIWGHDQEQTAPRPGFWKVALLDLGLGNLTGMI